MNDGPPRIASENLNLDSKSKRIIEELQHDGRRTYSEIGKAVGLSEAAVRQHLQRHALRIPPSRHRKTFA